jgi:hypothetical protein
MMKNAFALIAVTIALIGCATPYAPPTSGPTAQLILSVATQTVAPMQTYGLLIAPKNNEGCGELSGLIKPESFDKDKVVTIEGDRDILFHIGRSWGTLNCSNIFSQFHAKKDHEYTLNLDLMGQMCVVSIVEKSPDGTLTPIKPARAFKSSIGGHTLCDSRDKITGPTM